MFKKIKNKSVVQTVVDSITKAIISGELKPGDKIPTEMELAESFGVGRNSIREAIKNDKFLEFKEEFYQKFGYKD